MPSPCSPSVHLSPGQRTLWGTYIVRLFAERRWDTRPQEKDRLGSWFKAHPRPRRSTTEQGEAGGPGTPARAAWAPERPLRGRGCHLPASGTRSCGLRAAPGAELGKVCKACAPTRSPVPWRLRSFFHGHRRSRRPGLLLGWTLGRPFPCTPALHSALRAPGGLMSGMVLNLEVAAWRPSLLHIPSLK